MRLPRDVSAEDVFTNFFGDGRVIGFFVAEANKPFAEGLMVYGDAVGRCKEPGCKARKPHFKFTYRPNLADTLHAGLYYVYVVADAAPVTFELDLAGLSGSRDFRGGTRVPTVIKTLHGTFGEHQANVYSAGHFLESDSLEPEFGLVGIWAEGDSHIATGYGDCYYYPGDLNKPPAEEIAFLPGCPTGDGFEHTLVSEEPLEDDGFVYVSGNRGGPEGVGGWFSSASIPRRYGAVAAWVDLVPN